MTEFAGKGFAVGDVRGTRAWKVDDNGRLRGIVFEKVWRPGENTATCLRGVTPMAFTSAGGAGGGAGSSTFVTTTVSGGSGAFGGGARVVNFLGQPVTSAAGTCICGCGMKVSPEMPCDGMNPACGCGFYGYQEGSNDYYLPKPNNVQKGPIGGVFRGYGKVVLGTRGFRAEKAEILALYVDAEMLANSHIRDSVIRMRVEENYKVPVFDRYLDLLKAFPPDPPERPDDFWEVL